jgi:hypothetical protein
MERYINNIRKISHTLAGRESKFVTAWGTQLECMVCGLVGSTGWHLHAEVDYSMGKSKLGFSDHVYKLCFKHVNPYLPCGIVHGMEESIFKMVVEEMTSNYIWPSFDQMVGKISQTVNNVYIKQSFNGVVIAEQKYGDHTLITPDELYILYCSCYQYNTPTNIAILLTHIYSRTGRLNFRYTNFF